MRYINYIVIALIFISCKSKSTVSGWEYNTPENGGFMKTKNKTQEVGPGLTFIKGGTFNYKKKDVLMNSFSRSNS